MAAWLNSLDPALRPVRVAIVLLLWIGWTGCSAAPELSTPSDGLVFVRVTDAGDTDVFQARIADGAVRQLAETPEWLESNPEWLPSVQRVLYVARPVADPTASSRLMIRDPLRGDAAAVSEKSFLKEWDVSASADGKRLAYIFESPPGIVPPMGVRVASPMTGLDAMLGSVPQASAYLSPRFSPEAASVAVQIHGKNRGDDLWLLLNDGQREPLVNDRRWDDTAPRFTSLGSSIFFSRSAFRRAPRRRGRNAGRQVEPLGGGDVCRVQVATKQVDCVIQSGDAREHAVEPSPTREEIVFVREKDGASDLFLAEFEGGNERQLTDSPDRAERGPVWSPDGDRIAYADGRAAQPRIVVIDRQGAVLFETLGAQPGWAPPFQD